MFSLIGAIPWVVGLAFAGHALGGEWTNVRKGFEYVDYVVVALVVVGVAYAVVRRAARTPRAGDRCGRLSGALALRHAVALGLLQGPAELLPVSSSGHTTLIPWLAGWPYAQLDGELRKSFEVALHAGAGLALAIDMRGELLRERARAGPSPRAPCSRWRWRRRRSPGSRCGGPIERRLGGPRSIAAGLVGGAVAMALADMRPGAAAQAAQRAARRTRVRATGSRSGSRRRCALVAGGLAQRRDARRPRARAASRAAPRDAALLARGAAGDPRRARAQRPRALRRRRRSRAGARRRSRSARCERVPLDARSARRRAAAARARRLAAALLALPLCLLPRRVARSRASAGRARNRTG